MILIIPEVPIEYDREAMAKLMDLLSDPVRARIFLETLIHQEVTAKYLLDQLAVSRSTLSHHLKKLVEKGILDVRVEPTGRPIKHYSVNKTYEDPVAGQEVDESIDWLTRRVNWFEHTAVQLQAIANMATVTAKKLRSALQQREDDGVTTPDWATKLEKATRCFTLHLMTEKEAAMWWKKYMRFLEDFESKMKLGEDHTHIAFSGLLPIVSYRD